MKYTMKLNVTITESVHILAALYEKARRYEEETGESPRYVSLLAKKIRRQIRHDKDKRRRKGKDKAEARRNPGRTSVGRDSGEPEGERADTGKQHIEHET